MLAATSHSTKVSKLKQSLERAEEELGDTSILHHAFISIFIALWADITHYVTILMHILSYFTRFT